jgi:hypothetical protein
MVPVGIWFLYFKLTFGLRKRILQFRYKLKRRAAIRRKDWDLHERLRSDESKALSERWSDLESWESRWWVGRAERSLVPLAPNSYVGEEDGKFTLDDRLRWDALIDLKREVIKAERETSKHRREWIASSVAVISLIIAAWNALDTQRKIAEVTKRVVSIQLQLASQRAAAVLPATDKPSRSTSSVASPMDRSHYGRP